jgi:[ribosomal protein S5]-alanine N-acetyltransferase
VSRSTPEPPGILETERLLLRPLTFDDAPFVLELLNDPDWLRFIGDKGVRTLEEARRYIETGPFDSYAKNGFGMLLVEQRADRAPAGLCGLVRRDVLPGPDLGYAFLPAYRGRGYAREAAEAVLRFARETAGIDRVHAITDPTNARSIGVLEHFGFRFERMLRLSETDEVRLYARRF